jgi:hypothetical protein
MATSVIETIEVDEGRGQTSTTTKTETPGVVRTQTNTKPEITDSNESQEPLKIRVQFTLKIHDTHISVGPLGCPTPE